MVGFGASEGVRAPLRVQVLGFHKKSSLVKGSSRVLGYIWFHIWLGVWSGGLAAGLSPDLRIIRREASKKGRKHKTIM